MKQLIKIIFAAALIVSFGRCQMTYDPIVVLPNVSLASSGLTKVSTIKTYETDKYTVVMSRTEGLSKPADFDVIIDQTALDQYNELNGSDYTLMPSSLYTMGATEISFGEKVKTASFDITFKPAAILQAAGSATVAEKMVIPFVCTPKSDVNSLENKLTALVHLSLEDPKVTVEAPAAPEGLTFISGVAIPRRLELLCVANFKTLNPSAMSIQTTQQMVNDFNDAHGTSHLLLPEECYTIANGVFNSETMQLKYGITVEASGLDGTNTYLLPIKVASGNYTVVQDNIYYIAVSVQEIKYTVLNTDRYEAATKLTHEFKIEVRLNGALSDNVPIEFAYDASLIDDYNTAKGKTYEAFETSKINVTNSSMAGGSLTATVTVAVNMAGVAFENGKEYVLPFVLDRTKLPQGAQVLSDDAVFVRLKRTMYGVWKNASIDGYVTGTTGWASNNYMKATTTYNKEYLSVYYVYCNNFYSWDHGFHWYIDWAVNYDGDPNKRVVHTYSSAVSELTVEQMMDWVIDNGSYFDMTEGKVWFNFQYYWSQSDKDIDKRQTIKCYLESPLTPTEF